MSAHQPSTTPDGRGGTPVAAAGCAAREAPTMNELLAAGAAASAVSTPPDAVEEARRDKPAEPSGAPEAEDEDQDGRRAASTPGRDAA
ncbi:hypothetical protein [Streptomyces lydicus]|uniref:hypothetical protein n=1 Tax=Streptomyces lydicus TaxID=47763 RepID=UPI001012879C|nr:hypothetical protein [Streptomyces lydicus]